MGPLAVMERGLFFTFNGHPAAAPAQAAVGFLLTISGHGYIWLALFALVFLFGGRRGRRLALTGVLSVLLGLLAAFALRGIVQRANPAVQYTGVFVMVAYSLRYAFPSARMAASFAALPFLGNGDPALGALLWVFTLLVAYAGIYSGIHFPTDELGGALTGLACAGLAVALLGNPFSRTHRRRRRRRRPRLRSGVGT